MTTIIKAINCFKEWEKLFGFSRSCVRTLSLSVSSHQSFDKSQPVEPRRESFLGAFRSRILRNSHVFLRRFGRRRGCRDSDLVVAESSERGRCSSCTHECDGLRHSSILPKRTLRGIELPTWQKKNLYCNLWKGDLFKPRKKHLNIRCKDWDWRAAAFLNP